jgi:hypothetical protein
MYAKSDAHRVACLSVGVIVRNKKASVPYTISIKLPSLVAHTETHTHARQKELLEPKAIIIPISSDM